MGKHTPLVVEVSCSNCGNVRSKYACQVHQQSFCNQECFRQYHERAVPIVQSIADGLGSDALRVLPDSFLSWLVGIGVSGPSRLRILFEIGRRRHHLK
jgi:hypothetical protein